MSSALLPLAGLVAFPALIVAASFIRVGVEPLRRSALIAAGGMLLAALAVAATPGMRAVVGAAAVCGRAVAADRGRDAAGVSRSRRPAAHGAGDAAHRGVVHDREC